MFTDLFGLLSADMAIDLGTANTLVYVCLLYTSPSPRDATLSGMAACG